MGHDLDVYQGAIWIPLVILAPGQTEAARSDEVVTSADLPRLISKHLTGPAFAPFRKRFDTAKPSVPLIELHYTRPTELFNKAWGHRFRRIRRATYEWPHKYIASSDGAHELYDLEADPLELDNRIKRDPSLAAELARKLDERFTAMPKGEVDRTRKSMKKRQMRELRALGYAN